MTCVLEVEGLSAGYSGATVIRDISLHVNAGEIVAVLGANGAGKSTMLLSISGLVPEHTGLIKVFGESVSGYSPQAIARAGVAHVPEGRSLFPSLTIAEHMRIASRRRGVKTFEVLEKYFPSLLPMKNRRAGLLSGGEQQMLALARALASAPKLIMIDEMSLGLAPLVVGKLLKIVRSVADTGECAVLLVEQHVQLALDVVDRACIISHGSVVLAGAARDLKRDPQRVEAAYLGTTQTEGTGVIA